MATHRIVLDITDEELLTLKEILDDINEQGINFDLGEEDEDEETSALLTARYETLDNLLERIEIEVNV